ncbi:MAG: type VI secretion system tube protein Hcp [Oceanospirillaceae bacterium]|uniref:type VI secretion system tube protein TssD n=1 Tax=unclassified Thalassolituus TaxID=2624967 RepID=UPI000C0A42DD|nr:MULTISPECIES: type VI secretion system tube protein TssD [unclassified Thalassolituus]MAK90356.1 type VI secretion system tube protein Hcp [Thalassolituus sp.]MAS24015.1 type VI secretion system tube protein Hcp [Oceanospirillaceae bacterium]MAY01239.1 type VI secretion system tube protein Hcp [Oceanospirillaceae bacterium]MBL36390.1 type VI secretion system tube protein Hcp [Oceanospirillaceae bacterium]MBS52537.1 type VI secretion system tube protein Hcp [Oceanospirillaceae bacterium]|tara:strand:+ start:2476 stop:2958 length:483 start_codon:yes stop_codon:yes gene_type:complete
MALPGYMTITAETQGTLEGECGLENREGAIVVLACTHAIKLPTDKNGLTSGRRMHMPITILKDIDRTSPMLYQALGQSELLTEVRIDWYRIDSAGMEELYYSQILKNAQIVAIDFEVEYTPEGASSRLGHMEKVSFIYDSITWIHDVDGIEYEDNFGVVS